MYMSVCVRERECVCVCVFNISSVHEVSSVLSTTPVIRFINTYDCGSLCPKQVYLQEADVCRLLTGVNQRQTTISFNLWLDCLK